MTLLYRLIARRIVDTEAITSNGVQLAFDELEEEDREYLITVKAAFDELEEEGKEYLIMLKEGITTPRCCPVLDVGVKLPLSRSRILWKRYFFGAVRIQMPAICKV